MINEENAFYHIYQLLNSDNESLFRTNTLLPSPSLAGGQPGHH
jgi:hypothetical protein